MGGYVQGQDLDLDQAMQIWPNILQFLQQEDEEKCDFDKSAELLKTWWGQAHEKNQAVKFTANKGKA